MVSTAFAVRENHFIFACGDRYCWRCLHDDPKRQGTCGWQCRSESGHYPPVTAPPASSDTVPEKPLLTATVVEEGEQEGRTELSFHFKQPAACRDFNVDELQIVGKDASTLFEAASPELTRVCADETTGEAKADPSGTEIESTENQTDPNTGTAEGEDSSDPAEGEAVQSSESVGDAQENQTYSSQVTVKLDKPLDVSLVEKVVVDGVSYELSDESALSEEPEQTPENETDEGV